MKSDKNEEGTPLPEGSELASESAGPTEDTYDPATEPAVEEGFVRLFVPEGGPSGFAGVTDLEPGDYVDVPVEMLEHARSHGLKGA